VGNNYEKLQTVQCKGKKLIPTEKEFWEDFFGVYDFVYAWNKFFYKYQFLIKQIGDELFIGIDKQNNVSVKKNA